MKKGNDKKVGWTVLINYHGQVHKFEPDCRNENEAKRVSKFGLAKKLGIDLRVINNYFSTEKNNISVERRML